MRIVDLFAELGQLDPAANADRFQNLLDAASADLMRLAQEPSRDALDEFLEAARAALQRLPSFDPDVSAEQSAFSVGQTSMLIECAQWARLQKAPDQIVVMLRDSAIKRQMVRTLVMHGRLAMNVLAARVNKRPGNLLIARRELVQAGVITREESGRNVYLSATPLGAAALEQLGTETPGMLDLRSAEADALARAEATLDEAVRVEAHGRSERAYADGPQPDRQREVRDYVLAGRARVWAEPEEAMPAAADEAARGFGARFAADARHRTRTCPGGHLYSHQALASKLADCGSYLLTDQDLCLVASDPGMYLPLVLQPLAEGMALNVGIYLDGGLDLVKANVEPGPIWRDIFTEVDARRRTQLAPVPAGPEFLPVPEGDLVSSAA